MRASMVATRIQQFWNHPAGLKTIHFWAPTFKWGINVANIADLKKPADEIAYPLQAALAISGGIWARYSLVIKPRNLALFSVSAAMVATSTIQIARKYSHDYSLKKQALPIKEV